MAVVIALAGALLALLPGMDHVWLDAVEAVVPSVQEAFLTPTERSVRRSSREAIERSEAMLDAASALQRDAQWGTRPLDETQRERLAQFLAGRRELAAGDRMVLADPPRPRAPASALVARAPDDRARCRRRRRARVASRARRANEEHHGFAVALRSASGLFAAQKRVLRSARLRRGAPKLGVGWRRHRHPRQGPAAPSHPGGASGPFGAPHYSLG